VIGRAGGQVASTKGERQQTTITSMILLVPLFSAEGKKRLEDVETNCEDYNNDLSSSSSSLSFSSILASSASAGGDGFCYVQKQMIASFRKQRGNTCCGLASLAVLLTAAAKLPDQDQDQDISVASRLLLEEVNNYKYYYNKKKSCSYYYVDEDDVYPMVDMDVTDDAMTSNAIIGVDINSNNNNNSNAISSHIVSNEKIRRSGMTLDQITSLALALPTTKTAIAFFPSITTTTTDADADTNTANINLDDTTTTRLLSGPNELRKIICRVLSNPSSKEGLILNYHMTTLGQVPFGGHLSPIAAYHQRTDTVLIMDVWHTKTEPVWATIENIWNAISISKDEESQKLRGLLLIKHKCNEMN
jgi:hypothetical protein